MGSPLGGFFLSKINQQAKRQFDREQQVDVLVDFVLEKRSDILLVSSKQITVGERVLVESNLSQIWVESKIDDNGLLNLICTVSVKTQNSDCNLIGSQEFNCVPFETLSSLIQGETDFKLKLTAKPLEQSIH